jgi:site-specific recombinase XerD
MNKKNKGFLSFLAEEIEKFITYKRALGCKFKTEEDALYLLDAYLLKEKIFDMAEVTSELIEEFLASRPRYRPRSYNHLLGVTKGFFSWLVMQGICQPPPIHIRPKRATTHRIPFLFNRVQAQQLLLIASQLPDNPFASQRGKTYFMIFALLYGLGLRVSEVSHLQRADIDFNRNLLIIRQTKLSKSRLVPFGPKMAQHLQDYLQYHEEYYGTWRPESPVFSFRQQRSINPHTISRTFHDLVPHLNLVIPPGTSSPRLHDLRHSFAVGALLRWYRAGIKPAQRLFHLSTFLGHVDPSSTATYLTITEDLLKEANQRFEQFIPLSIKEKQSHD